MTLNERQALDIYRTFCRKNVMDLVGAVYAGMIPKNQLAHGKWYVGYCRNASKAWWNAEQQVFSYKRVKWSYEYWEDIPHPEDDEGYDIFVPVALIEEN